MATIELRLRLRAGPSGKNVNKSSSEAEHDKLACPVASSYRPPSIDYSGRISARIVSFRWHIVVKINQFVHSSGNFYSGPFLIWQRAQMVASWLAHSFLHFLLSNQDSLSIDWRRLAAQERH